MKFFYLSLLILPLNVFSNHLVCIQVFPQPPECLHEDKDDDNDGYVDDVNGWNAFNSNGNVSSDGHGTHVAGIVGAEGNNGSMVAGVNWNVKLMVIEKQRIFLIIKNYFLQIILYGSN